MKRKRLNPIPPQPPLLGTPPKAGGVPSARVKAIAPAEKKLEQRGKGQSEIANCAAKDGGGGAEVKTWWRERGELLVF